MISVNGLLSHLRHWKGRSHNERFFSILPYAREKALLDEHLYQWGYEATKGMVAKCEQVLIDRFGSADAVDSIAWLLSEIKQLYNLIDNELMRIPGDLLPQIRHALAENLFGKLDALKKMMDELNEQ